MSGFEIAGVILGALPIAIEGAKYYQKLYSRMKAARNGLQDLVQDLETERIRLRNTCELLLDGIVEPWKIDGLMENPFGPDWEPYNNRISLRLWTSLDMVQRRLKTMRDAALALKEELAIPADEKESWWFLKVPYIKLQKKIPFKTHHKSKHLGFRRAGAVVFRWEDYNEILTSLRGGNAALEKVVLGSIKLGPSRENRSRDRFIKLMRRLSQGVFEAICGATTCQCLGVHRLCLELVPREELLLPSDSDDQVAPNHHFHVIFDAQVMNRNGDTKQTNGGQSTWSSQPRWESLAMRPTQMSTISTPLELASSIKPAPISDLCRLIGKRGKMQVSTCYGYLTEGNYTFGIHDHDQSLQMDSSTTLRDVFDAQDQELEFQEKIRIALAISSGTLHLYETDWMAAPLALDSVLLFQARSGDVSQPLNSSLRHPFLTCDVRRTTNTHNSATSYKVGNGPLNLAVLSLGAILTQIAIGKKVEALNIPGTPDTMSVITVHRQLDQLLGEVQREGGWAYKSAVEWCYNNTFQVASLGDQQQCNDFYVQVVKRLQSDSDRLDRL